jgi:hypothetical protein
LPIRRIRRIKPVGALVLLDLIHAGDQHAVGQHVRERELIQRALPLQLHRLEPELSILVVRFYMNMYRLITLVTEKEEPESLNP